jgi:flagella basal body P-ring formation protein FlgA
MQMNVYIHRRDMPWAHERPRLLTLPRPLSWALGICLATAVCLASVQAQTATPSGRGQALAPSEPQAALIEQARQWLLASAPQQGAAASIAFAPLDARLQIQGCQGPIAFDQPFPSQPSSLRARCLKPDWTVFLQRTDQTAVSMAKAPAAKTTPTGPPMKRVVVAVANLSANQPVEASLFKVEERPLAGPASTYFTTTDGLEFAQVVRAIPAGQAIRATDLRPSILVRRGQPVVLAVERVPGLSIQITVEALEDGRFGDQIRFKNKESGRITTGQIVGRGHARAS